MGFKRPLVRIQSLGPRKVLVFVENTRAFLFYCGFLDTKLQIGAGQIELDPLIDPLQV